MSGASRSDDAAPVSSGLKQSVVAHYESSLRKHGSTAAGVGWKDEASQRLRFRVLCEVCDLAGLSIHDLGCGVGHLLDFLDEHGIDVEYSGSDLSARMIEEASLRHPEASFERRDILVGEPDRRYDVVLCSGVFNVKLDRSDDEWWHYIQAMLTRMFSMTGVAMAFNLMSDQVDYRSESLYYPSLDQVSSFCRTHLSRFFVLRHDYPLYEATIYVYRHPPLARAGRGMQA